jgi:hypothetical protein
MSEGKGVDVVLDLTDDFAVVDEAFGGRRFNTVICFSVLEHCNHPFKMCENLTELLEPGRHSVHRCALCLAGPRLPVRLLAIHRRGDQDLVPRPGVRQGTCLHGNRHAGADQTDRRLRIQGGAERVLRLEVRGLRLPLIAHDPSDPQAQAPPFHLRSPVPPPTGDDQHDRVQAMILA